MLPPLRHILDKGDSSFSPRVDADDKREPDVIKLLDRLEVKVKLLAPDSRLVVANILDCFPAAGQHADSVLRFFSSLAQPLFAADRLVNLDSVSNDPELTDHFASKVLLVLSRSRSCRPLDMVYFHKAFTSQ